MGIRIAAVLFLPFRHFRLLVLLPLYLFTSLIAGLEASSAWVSCRRPSRDTPPFFFSFPLHLPLSIPFFFPIVLFLFLVLSFLWTFSAHNVTSPQKRREG